MSRAQRLLDLIQVLRRHRHPVSGPALAEDSASRCARSTATSRRCKAQGANIDGEPGVGYVLRPGFTLPPLMFSEDEIEALVLGSRWVRSAATARWRERPPTRSPRSRAVLPDDLRESRRCGR